MLTVGPILRSLRLSTLISLSLNAAVAALGGVLVGSMPGHCRHSEMVFPAGAAAAAIAKVVCMIGAGITQGAVASTIARRSIGAPFDPDRDFHLVAQVIYEALNASASLYPSLSLSLSLPLSLSRARAWSILVRCSTGVAIEVFPYSAWPSTV
jgi:hypothetical protein